MPICDADFLDDNAGMRDNMSLQRLAELTSDPEVMRKCMLGQLQRLKQHDSRCVTFVFHCRRLEINFTTCICALNVVRGCMKHCLPHCLQAELFTSSAVNHH